MKKLWILFAIAVLLLFMGFRERFEATENIKDPATWTDAEVDRIKGMVNPKSTESNAIVKQIVGGFWPIWKEEKLRVTLDDVSKYLGGQPYITASDAPLGRRTEFTEMINQYYIVQGQSLFRDARGYDPNDFSSYLERTGSFNTPTGIVRKPAIGDTDTLSAVSSYMGIPRNDTDRLNIYITKLVTFYDNVYMPEKNIPSREVMESYAKQALPDVNGLPDSKRASFINLLNYWFTSPELRGSSSAASTSPYEVSPVCPVGYVMNTNKTECEKADYNPCDEGYEVLDDVKCKKINGTETKSYTCPPPSKYSMTAKKCVYDKVPVNCPADYTFQRAYPPGGSITGEGTCKSNNASSFNTSGGSSGGLFGGRSGGPTQGDQPVYGPNFVGFGSLAGPTYDSSKTNTYPKLIGGMVNTPSTRSDAANMIVPYKESKFPGDLDFIPDPYRVSLTYNASSYSSGKEPIPFLTDFSAFQK